MLSKIRQSVDKKMMVQLYYSFMYPYLKYGIIAWDNTNKKLTHEVQLLQNKILRIINFKSLKDHTRMCTLYKSMHILQFKDIFELDEAKFVYAYHNDKLPSNIDGIFNPVQNQHNYGTRSIAKENLYAPRMKLHDGYSSLNYIGVKIWNEIPATVKSLSQHAFSRQHKNLLFHKY